MWALFVAYALAGFSQPLVMRGGDRDRLFPLSSWALFARVPGEITDDGVRVVELNGARLGSPDVPERLGDRLPAMRRRAW